MEIREVRHADSLGGVMGADSKIEWTDHTFNPWIGCQEVSPACDHCYAKAQNDYRKWVNGWGPHGERRRTSAANWRQPIKWNAAAEKAGVRARVFCASLADVFDNQVLAEWRADLWRLIDATPNLDWLLLTKRPQNAAEMMIAARRAVLGANVADQHLAWPWPNVWVGVSVENQEEADRRIPDLLATPAAVRFLSCEPLLGPVDLHLRRLRATPQETDAPTDLHSVSDRIHWVIVGGESGPNARPMHPDWARSLRDQCQAAGVPFFLKQWGEWVPQLGSINLSDDPERSRFTWAEWTDFGGGPPKWEITENPAWCDDMDPEQCMIRVGKKKAGAMLDGREWREFPA